MSGTLKLILEIYSVIILSLGFPILLIIQGGLVKFKPKIREIRWRPELEKKIRKIWDKEKIFAFNVKTKRKIFSLDTPPPYPRSA